MINISCPKVRTFQGNMSTYPSQLWFSVKATLIRIPNQASLFVAIRGAKVQPWQSHHRDVTCHSLGRWGYQCVLETNQKNGEINHLNEQKKAGSEPSKSIGRNISLHPPCGLSSFVGGLIIKQKHHNLQSIIIYKTYPRANFHNAGGRFTSWVLV